MKLTPQHYAQSLFEVTAGQSPESIRQAVMRLAQILRRRHATRSLPAILRAIERLEEEASGRQLITATVAEHSSETARTLATLAREVFAADQVDIHLERDATLIGGVKLRSREALWDATLRTRVQALRRVLKRA